MTKDDIVKRLSQLAMDSDFQHDEILLRNPEIDYSKLSEADLKEHERWEERFQSVIWQLYNESRMIILKEKENGEEKKI